MNDTWKWATVTAVTPAVKVRYDGETTAKLATPQTLVQLAQLKVGTRVRVHAYGRDRIITGIVSGGSWLPDTGWIDLPLASGWTIPGSGNVAQYRRFMGMVECQGWVVNATATAAAFVTAWTFPANFRPGVLIGCPVTSNTTATLTSQIDTAGVASMYQSVVTNAWRPLNGIRFQQVN